MPGHRCFCHAGRVTAPAAPALAEQPRPAGPPDPEFLVPGLPYTGPELRAMEISGMVDHVIGDLYLPAGGGSRAQRVRAAAVRRLAAPLLGGPWTATGLTAAWIHDGGPAPGVLEASVERFHRIPLRPLSVGLRLEQSDAARHAGDVVEIWGTSCTSVDRTIEDLLRRAGDPVLAPPAVAAARRLLAGAEVPALRARFEARRRRPGMAAARRALDRLAGGP
jgi:hypothetical protein